MKIRMMSAASGLGAVALALAFGGGVALMQDGGPGDGRGPGFRGRSPVFAAIDADHDGSLSAAEIANAPAALQTLDKNADGQLTAEELRPAFGPRAGRPDGPGARRDGGEEARGDNAASPADDDLVSRLMAFDTNKDGALSRSELPARMQGLFARADANKDDLLTADELKASADAQQGTGGPAERRGGRGRDGGPGFRRMDPIAAAIDVDRDGTLSAAEIAGAGQALAVLDGNKDGQLTMDEIRPFGGGRAPRNR
jgi:Ca2+-binding EF-hand superfamily protein